MKLLLIVKHFAKGVNHHLRLYASKAEEVVIVAFLVAEKRARAASHIKLHHIFLVLFPAHESAVGVRSPPNRHHRHSHQRSEVHVHVVH